MGALMVGLLAVGVARDIGEKTPHAGTNRSNGKGYTTTSRLSDSCMGTARSCGNTKPRSNGNSGTSSGTSETEILMLRMAQRTARHAMATTTTGIEWRVSK